MNLRLEFKKVYSSAPKILEDLKNILEVGRWLEPNIFLITTGLTSSTTVFRGHSWKFHFIFNWPLEFSCLQTASLSPVWIFSGIVHLCMYWALPGKRTNREVGCLAEDIQGYWRNNKMNFLEWSKINMEFPEVTKQNHVEFPGALFLYVYKFQRGQQCNTILFLGGKLCFLWNSQG